MFLIAPLEIAGFFLSFLLTYSAPIRLIKEDIKPGLYIKSAIFDNVHNWFSNIILKLPTAIFHKPEIRTLHLEWSVKKKMNVQT